jgi:hypothetical protein
MYEYRYQKENALTKDEADVNSRKVKHRGAGFLGTRAEYGRQ